MVEKLRALTATQIGIIVAAVSAIGVVGAVGVSNAAPAGKPTKEQCAAQGYKNYGQCVKEWAHNKGYGA